MERLTKKQEPIDLLGDGTYCNYAVPNHNEFHTATAIANKLGKLEDLEEELGCPLEVVIEHINESYKILCQHIEINEKYVELKKYSDITELTELLKISNDIALSKEQKGLCEKHFTWLRKDKSE